MKLRTILLAVLLCLAVSANAFAITSFDYASIRTFDGVERASWYQTFFTIPSPAVNGHPFTLDSFTWSFLLGGFRPNSDVSFTARFDNVQLTFSGHTTANGMLLSTTSITNSVTLGNLAAAFSDGAVRIVMDSRYLTFVSGGFGSGHVTGPVAPEPATMLLIGAGLAGLPIARRLKKGSQDS